MKTLPPVPEVQRQTVSEESVDGRKTLDLDGVQPKKLDPWGGFGDRLQAAFTRLNPEAADSLVDLREALGVLQQNRNPHTAPIADEVSATPLYPGVASGVVLHNTEEALDAAREGTPYVFVATTLDAATVQVCASASGIIVNGPGCELLARLGRPTVIADSTVALDHTVVTVDGTRGAVLPAAVAALSGDENALQRATNALNVEGTLQINAEASSVAAIGEARLNGATGVRIDLDHVLQEPDVLPFLREFYLQTEDGPKRDALKKIGAAVREHVKSLSAAAGDMQVRIALGTRGAADFFPRNTEALQRLAKQLNLPLKAVEDRVAEMGAGNSKLGIRGARLLSRQPQLFRELAAASWLGVSAAKESGELELGFVVPSVSFSGEMEEIRGYLEETRKRSAADLGRPLVASYGAGIENARAALNADVISNFADFFEFGLGELTETVFAMSPDDANEFITQGMADDIYPADPTVELDATGVGRLVQVAQYITGDAANSFPCTLRGNQAGTRNGALLARTVGANSLTVSTNELINARMTDLETMEALEHGVGLQVPPSTSRGDRFALGVMVDRSAIRNAEVGLPSEVPDGSTAHKYLDRLVRMVDQRRLTPRDALLRLPPDIIDSLAKPIVEPGAEVTKLAGGIAASPGCSVGKIALSAERAAEFKAAGEPYILVVNEVHGDEVQATRDSSGLISVRGGRTSHSAMIAANSDVPCVLNGKIQINTERGTVRIGRQTLKDGDTITLDGTHGLILQGEAPIIDPSKSPAFATMVSWLDEHAHMKVMANADTPDEAIKAFAQGAAGVGLVRSEHMFFGDRLGVFRRAILAKGEAMTEALAELEEFQTEDYTGLIAAADGKAVTVRLLDPPLYEFLPTDGDRIRELAKDMDLSVEEVTARIEDAQEIDSLMGLRGVRLANMRPAIERMQVRALARAHTQALANGQDLAPLKILVPMISTAKEMEQARARIQAVLSEVSKESGQTIEAEIGAMIETPRAAIEAYAIGQHADMLSYGTNDLTQQTLGFGRNVSPLFLPDMISKGILDANPGHTIDLGGVGRLIRITQVLGRGQPGRSIKTGICGAQGSDPSSVLSFEALGGDYVSVSPGQIMRARFAAAQAAILNESGALLPEKSRAARTEAVVSKATRLMEAVGDLPVTFERQPLIEGLRHVRTKLLAQVRELVTEVEQTGDYNQIEKHSGVLRALFEVGTLLHASSMSAKVHGEIQRLRSGTISATQSEALGRASVAIEKFETLYNQSNRESSRSNRALAAALRDGLRELESVNAESWKVGLPTARSVETRLRHINDSWDNNYYTREGPADGESMSGYMKRVAKDFLVDNGLETHMHYAEPLPTDRPVILAVTHRSGAIDRFISFATLPLEENKSVYMVRKDSPLDVVAQNANASDPHQILGIESYDQVIEALQSAVADGVEVIVTYPEATGTVGGEARYPASSVPNFAAELGAVVVPVTISDSFLTRPMAPQSIEVRARKSIDPERIARSLGVDVEDDRVATVAHSLMRYRMGAVYG